MLWEFLAVAFIGLGGAGIALGIHKLFKAPKWIVPALAGLCMLGFTIYSEYTWYPHTKERLPAGAVVVATVPHTAFYKPWSYAVPQILQFVTLDTTSVKPINDTQKLVNLYFFERRMKAHTLAIAVDCTTHQQATVLNLNPIRLGKWHDSPYKDSIKQNLC